MLTRMENIRRKKGSAGMAGSAPLPTTTPISVGQNDFRGPSAHCPGHIPFARNTRDIFCLSEGLA